MSKEDFLNQLAYGTCNGSVELVSPQCIEGSPGCEPAPCPVKLAEGNLRHPSEYICNCCEKCRSNCEWVAQVKRVNIRKRNNDLEAINRYLDEHGDG